jgi:Bacteriocin-protection, YdeI or OmpD-Associated
MIRSESRQLLDRAYFGWNGESTLREKVAEASRQAEEDCARLWPERGDEVGQALLHLPEKERGNRHPAGALLNDPKHILQKIGQVQAGRWIKFTSLKEIRAAQSILRNYIREAIEVEKSGKKVTFKKASDYAVPEELQARLDAAPELRAAFEALTPGRRKSFIFHVSGAKQAKTRAARAERCVPMILSGRGFNERA